MHYMKDVFEGKVSEHAHNKFVRYSKGNFVGPLVNIKISKANVKVSASFHFVDELLMMVAKVLGDKVVHVEGTLVWNDSKVKISWKIKPKVISDKDANGDTLDKILPIRLKIDE